MVLTPVLFHVSCIGSSIFFPIEQFSVELENTQ